MNEIKKEKNIHTQLRPRDLDAFKSSSRFVSTSNDFSNCPCHMSTWRVDS